MGNFYAEIEISAVISVENVPGTDLEDAFLTLREDDALESRVRRALRGEGYLGEDYCPGDVTGVHNLDIRAIRLVADDGASVEELYRLADK